MAKTTRIALLLILVILLVGACNLQSNIRQENSIEEVAQAATTRPPTETLPPYTPLATLTPSPTLRPPPTFEPPTPTRPPTLTPSITPTSTIDLSVSIPGLHGAETPTPTSTQGCTPRKDWKLRYTVQRGDALQKIADRYSTSVNELVQGNCLTDKNLITIGQELRVPGTSQPPSAPAYDCSWEVLTPLNNTFDVPGEGQLTFNWRGPRSARNLIRVIKPDGGVYEQVFDLRQNDTINLDDLPLGGQYTWYVFPLDENFAQIPCKEGGPWIFNKAAKPPTPTPPPASGGGLR